jgi:hypothetical protein
VVLLPNLDNHWNVPDITSDFRAKTPANDVIRQALGQLKNYYQEAMKSGPSVLDETSPRIFQTEVETIDHILGDLNHSKEGLQAVLGRTKRLGNHWGENADALEAFIADELGGIPNSRISCNQVRDLV